MPTALLRSGISLTNTCADIQTQTLARRLALEIASARARKPGIRTEVGLSCNDVQVVMTLYRPAPEPPITRDFIWQAGTRKQPERWLALAIHQSQQYDKIGGALVQSLRELIAGEFEQRPAALLAALNAGGDEGAESDLNDLAALFYGLSARGPAERKACLQILAAFSAYVERQG